MKNFSLCIHVFLLTIILFNLSCAKQEAPTIEGSGVRTQQEIDRLEACSRVNFNKGVLLHLNSLYLFKCSKWDEEFPKMYQAIKRVRSSSWDHLMAPIDKEFVENLSRRDRVFKNIKDLDAKNGLDDLSRVLVALNETNFFDSVKKMFQCVENSEIEICADRLGKIPQKESLMNIIRLIDIKPETIQRGSRFVKELNVAIGTNEEALRLEINKFKQDPAYINVRLKLVDALSKKVQAGFTKDDREFLSKILQTRSTKGNLPWIYTWFHDAKMTREKFKDLVEYPTLINPNFVGEFKGLKKAYDDGFSCTIKNTVNPNDLISFDFKTGLADYVSIIKEKDFKGFYDHSSSMMTGLKMSTEVCGEFEQNKYNTNFIKMLSNFANFMSEKKFYDLVKFLVKNTTATGELDKTFAENLYIADLVASEMFSSTNAFNEQVFKHTKEFYPVIYDIAQNLSAEAFIDLGVMFQETLTEDNDLKLKGVADFWNFFNDTEKNFLFNFVDRHFDDDTQYVLLFDFYTKFLDDMIEVQPVFKDSWMGTSEKEQMSYLALQDVFYQLDGKDTLLDFQKFFSRDQILRVLEVISNGKNIHAEAKSELAYINSSKYLAMAKTDGYKFDILYVDDPESDYDAKGIVECMKKFAEIENGFYQLVLKLPEACTAVTHENIAFKMFGWMNKIEDTYNDSNPGKFSTDSLLSKKGILSPYLLNTGIATAKILDNLLGDIDSVLPTKKGIEYLTTSAKFHLNEKKASDLVDKNLNWLSRWFDVLPEDNLIHRSAILKSFTSEKNFAKANDVTKNLANLSIQYSDWVKSGKHAQVSKRSFGEHDPNNDCDKVINKFVSKYPCPSVEIVKKHSNEILKYLSTTWEKNEGTAIAHLMKAVKPGEGLDIPLDSSNTKKYRITLKEVFKYLYDTSDKSLAVNRTKTHFVNDQWKSSNEVLTTLERVEVVIREVRFDNNYLGVAFLNAITKAQDYNDEVDKRKGLLSKCIKIPVIRCTRRMSDDDLRMAKNALETFDSLSDINNGNGRESKLQYGFFLKTFEQTLVASSAKAAQEVRLRALDDDELVRHNGRLLGDMTAMTMWSNAARVIRDRVGRTNADFVKFIESKEFNRVNNALLYGFDLPQAAPSAERLLKKIKTISAGDNKNALDNTIEWVASLNYEQTRLVEDTVARLLLTSSYLGSPDFVFGVASTNPRFESYKNNNLLQIFLALEKVIDFYPTLKNFFPGDAKLIDAFKPVNTALIFLNESLASTTVPEKNTAYIALNDVFSIAQSVLFDSWSDPRFATLNEKSVKGLDLLIGHLQKPNEVAATYNLIRDDYRYLDVLHANNASWFKAIGLNLNRVASSDKIDLKPVRDYLNFTTKSAVCLNRDSECVSNYHFDEPAKLVKYLNKTNEDGLTYFKVAANKLLVENFDQLNEMFNCLITAVKIKEVKPPLRQ